MRKQPLLQVLALILLLAMPFCAADLGPKPTVTINVTLQGQPITELFAARMLECIPLSQTDRINSTLNNNPQDFDFKRQLAMQAGLSEDTPLGISNFTYSDPTAGCFWAPDHFAFTQGCRSNVCEFFYYPPERFRLAIYLPSQNKIFFTNEIERRDFNSKFAANINADGSATITRIGLSLQEGLGEPANQHALYSFALTLIIELIGAAYYAHKNKLSMKLVLIVAVANMISLPIVWFVIPPYISDFVTMVLVTEAFAVLFEAAFIWKVGSDLVNAKQALALSFVLNMASFILGNIILMMFLQF